MGDLLTGIIDDDGKMVGGADILARQDHIAEECWDNGLGSMNQIIEYQRAGNGCRSR